jgi:TPR repeat protein
MLTLQRLRSICWMLLISGHAVAFAQVKLPGGQVMPASALAVPAVQAAAHEDCAQPVAAQPDIQEQADGRDNKDEQIQRPSIRASSRAQRSPRLDDALQARARGGDSQAAWRAAVVSFRGDCRASNYGESLVYLQMAAQSGHACAIGAVGLMHGKGWGTARDLNMARESLERSVQAGCKRAHYWAWLVDEAVGRPQTRQRALEQLEQGAATGDGHALNALGVLRETSNRRTEARQLYQQAAAQGNATARQNIARLQRYFAQTSEKPSLQALQQRAQSGEAAGQYLLARRLHQGDGVAISYGQAFKLYQQAAQTGHAAAREMLQLLQARLAATPAHEAAIWADLALVELRSDELLKSRGVVQPIEDIDPFAGL